MIIKKEMYLGFWWGSQKETTLGRPRRKCEDNIMDLREIG
jgi:hypothetical protein